MLWVVGFVLSTLSVGPAGLARNGSVTAEVARRQPDGSWLWIIDRYEIAREGRDIQRPFAVKPAT